MTAPGGIELPVVFMAKPAVDASPRC